LEPGPRRGGLRRLAGDRLRAPSQVAARRGQGGGDQAAPCSR